MTEAEILKQLKIEKIKAMKNPNILMNTTDFENLKKHVESTVENFKIGDPPTFNGYPITPRSYMEQGKIFVIDAPIRQHEGYTIIEDIRLQETVQCEFCTKEVNLSVAKYDTEEGNWFCNECLESTCTTENK